MSEIINYDIPVPWNTIQEQNIMSYQPQKDVWGTQVHTDNRKRPFLEGYVLCHTKHTVAFLKWQNQWRRLSVVICGQEESVRHSRQAEQSVFCAPLKKNTEHCASIKIPSLEIKGSTMVHANSKMIEEVGTCPGGIKLSTKGGNCEASTAKDIILEESSGLHDAGEEGTLQK